MNKLTRDIAKWLSIGGEQAYEVQRRMSVDLSESSNAEIKAAAKAAHAHMTRRAPVTAPLGRFVVRSDAFGYGMWAADVPGCPEVEITDRQDEIANFGTFAAAECTARALTHLYGYKWTALACVTAPLAIAA